MPTQSAHGDSRLSLLTAAADARDRRVALAFVVAIVVVFLAITPQALRPLPRVDGFIPAVQSSIFATDLITAILLFAHFATDRARALVWLASGYLFSAVLVAAQALTFPGAFSTTGLLGAGPQTAAWLYVPWHVALPAAAAAYAWLKRRSPDEEPRGATAVTIRRAAIASVLAAVAIVAGALLAGDALPVLVVSDSRFTASASIATALPLLLSVVAFVLVWRQRTSVLDEWLTVALTASIAETALIVFVGASRYTLAFYTSRLFAVVVASAVLVALLVNMTRLYARLSIAVTALERQRAARLMNLDVVVGSIGHEIKQPLTVIGTCATVIDHLLRKPAIEIDEVRLNLSDMRKASARIAETIDSLRGLFRDSREAQQAVDVNELVNEALEVLGPELRAREIAVERELAAGLPPVIGHKGQLREVLVNIVQNAVEAMAPVTDRRRELAVTTGYDRGSVVIGIRDSGPGIAPERLPGLFTAAISTKPTGMGLGLSLCQMIVDRHSGRLGVSSELGRGTSFEVSLPAAAAG
jgi:signal transduction histidine kinase